MQNFSPDKLLNDAEINFLADLFLAHLGADKSTRDYRLLRNAVILYSHGAWTIGKTYELVGSCAELSANETRKRIKRLLDGLAAPAHETFNRAYAPPAAPYETHTLKIAMSDKADVDYVVSFFGYAFLYLVVTNYNKYEYLNID